MNEPDYIFCDQCIKDITNKRKLKGNPKNEADKYITEDNIFCSRQCELVYRNVEIQIETLLRRHPCRQCGGFFSNDHFEKFNKYGVNLCSWGCMFRWVRNHPNYLDYEQY